MKYDYAIYIGRFQPFHHGHFNACKQGLDIAKHLIILVGSAFAAPNIRNPFTFEQRREMITAALNEAGYKHFTIMPLRDYYYSDDAWVTQVQQIVKTIAGSNSNIALLGYKKDSSSYYLDLFPTWNFHEIESDFVINATDIRYTYFEAGLVEHPKERIYLNDTWKKQVTVPIYNYLKQLENVEQYSLLVEAYKDMRKYEELWSRAPYPPTFVTTDAVVTCGGHILLIERRDNPGKGLVALPGGFVDPDQKLVDSCIRELREETKLKVAEPILRGSIQKTQVFDHPLRSQRGNWTGIIGGKEVTRAMRTITHGFYIPLQVDPKDKRLPPVKGSDDAKRAFWRPLNEAMSSPELFFEDHYSIIESFIGRGK